MNESMVTAARLMEMDALAEYVPPEILSERLVEMAREQAGLAAEDVSRLRHRLVGAAAERGNPRSGEDSAAKSGETWVETDNERRKVCARCGDSKPMDAFRANEHTGDGRDTRCIECLREIGLKREEKARIVEAHSGDKVGSPTKGFAQAFAEASGEDERRCESCGESKPKNKFHGASSTRCRSCVKRGSVAAGHEPAQPSGGVASRDEESDEEALAAVSPVNPDEVGEDREEPEGLKKLAVKRCERCDKRKPLSSFEENPNTADGHTNACSACLRQLNSNREYYKEAGL